jgi:hypothetical protein
MQTENGKCVSEFTKYKYISVTNAAAHNIILQHPVALQRSDFAFCFYAIYMQHQLLFTCRFSLLTLHVLA